MSIKPKLIATALAEWTRWGGSVRPLHGAPAIGGTETKAPYVGYVNDYWKVVGKPNWNGATPQAWSAAFISFCFKTAGAGTGFAYSTGHVDYCRAILAGRSPGLSLVDPATTTLAVGDLIWAARSGDGCNPPPMTYKAAVAALKAGEWFCSHCDIVVEMEEGAVDVIGGNVSNSVTQTTYSTTQGRITDGRHAWLGVIKNNA